MGTDAFSEAWNAKTDENDESNNSMHDSMVGYLSFDYK